MGHDKFEFTISDIAECPLYTKVFFLDGFQIMEYYCLGFQPTLEKEKKLKVLFTDDLNSIRVADIRQDDTVYYKEWGFAVNELIRRLEDRLNFVKKNWV